MAKRDPDFSITERSDPEDKVPEVKETKDFTTKPEDRKDLPLHEAALPDDGVKVKSPGGGSISHEGKEYKPDGEGFVHLPLHVIQHIEGIAHTPPVQHEAPIKVKFETEHDVEQREKKERELEHEKEDRKKKRF